ncbi:biotin--[acetyl-CoA-carboxylase] ligase [Proteiniphilum sp. X52]|uniref:biotin--[acetyl-CoA-carboxylase] ligase n=1 Tax=Proteiniphilum sp. X52 TaxID=2382159 RepID=UPI000F0A8A06|nr:biotin--[acetyl-CoA-carboxylase] ligase [Proteiniphilum sp. X52]RNC66952.1 biotin--[acetyl-CoA-carboxylase] ligase [Proteiniphilum sp. X52]
MEQLSKERRIIRVEATESTNLYLKQLLREEQLEEGSMVIADFQTVGRGQMGNSWFSSKGENLLFSLLIYPRDVRANEQFIISRIASLAVKNTLDRFADDIRIKWPNDIYWKERKIAGILIENDIEEKHITNSVIGIGVNVNEKLFPPDLPNPVSLRQITGSIQDRDYILDIFQREFFLLYRDFQKGDIKAIEDEYMLDLYRAKGYYWYEDKNGRFMAEIDEVLPSGHLVLKTMDTDEVRTYAFKEVAFVDE